MRDLRHCRMVLSLLVVLGPPSVLAAGCAPAVVGAGGTTAAAAVQERGLGGALSDTGIRIDINHLWFQESEILYRKVQLQVQEGRVLLSGAVPDPETRVNAVRLVWQVPGVREVINEIEVDDETTLTDKARDAVISTKLKTRLLTDQDVSSINYSIEVVNQSIFLIGVAQNQAELDRVVAHAKDIAYVRRVKSYVRVKEQMAEES